MTRMLSSVFVPASASALTIVLCGLSLCETPLRDKKPTNPRISIEVEDEHEIRVAATPAIKSPAVLTFEHEYQPGDHVVVGGPQRMILRLDGNMPECFLYRSGSSPGKTSFDIPYGRAENQTGSAFDPESFGGKLHKVTARLPTAAEVKSYRNLALNPCDQLRPDGSVQVYPHASSNSVSRSLFDFEARNAIDGISQNGHHGVWPYESWGPQLRKDIWWKVDFGRIVELDKVRLMVRADFPHDGYWKRADLEFSDGSRVPIQIGPAAEFQEFPFPKRRVSWLRIANVVPDDPAKWCSFIEVEAWGTDLP